MIGDVQKTADERWWTRADPVTRTRALPLQAVDLLPEDMQVEFAMAGVTVTAVGCGWDHQPEGYWCLRFCETFCETTTTTETTTRTATTTTDRRRAGLGARV